MIKEIFSGKLPAVLNNPTPIALEFGSEGSSDSQRLHSIMEQVSADQKEVSSANLLLYQAISLLTSHQLVEKTLPYLGSEGSLIQNIDKYIRSIFR